VALSQILGRNERTPEGSKVLWDYACEHFIRPNLEAGKIRDDSKQS
jgi:putative hydrolase of HD superfamily